MRWIHIAGIAGKATSNLSVTYKQLGYFVTGSDHQCLPPATIILDQNEIPYADEYVYTHLTKQFWEEKLGKELDIPEHPELAVFGSALSKHNKEYRFAELKNVRIKTFAQALGDLIAKSNSIVSVGTAGKTTTTALLVKITQALGLNPSYMIGAELADGSSAMQATDSDWSVMEGDEYYGVDLEPHSKFFEYKPKFVLLGKITWDHADVFKTAEDYQANFERLAQNLPEDGLLLVNAADPVCVAVAQKSNARVVWFSAYESTDLPHWRLEKLAPNRFKAFNPGNDFELEFEFNLPGKYNQQNALGAIAMVYEVLGKEIDFAKVAKSLAEFKGVKKRLEIISQTDDLVVVDDLGGPPLKVASGTEALKERFPGMPIYAIYEPNSGNRVESSIAEYNGAFKDLSEVIIPELSVDKDGTLLDAETLVNKIGAPNAKHLKLAEAVSYLAQKPGPKVVVFFSSYRLTTAALDFAHA